MKESEIKDFEKLLENLEKQGWHPMVCDTPVPFYDNDVMTDTDPTHVEPWEPNVTTLVDFDSKWKSLLSANTPIPTDPNDNREIGVYEGGAYSSKGIYRGAFNCRMRTNHYPTFCKVCQHALRDLIDFYTR